MLGYSDLGRILSLPTEPKRRTFSALVNAKSSRSSGSGCDLMLEAMPSPLLYSSNWFARAGISDPFSREYCNPIGRNSLSMVQLDNFPVQVALCSYSVNIYNNYPATANNIIHICMPYGMAMFPSVFRKRSDFLFKCS